ncbi:MAG: hypothetical protein R2706_15915 [Acidimicrobiales bacterium]
MGTLSLLAPGDVAGLTTVDAGPAGPPVVGTGVVDAALDPQLAAADAIATQTSSDRVVGQGIGSSYKIADSMG